MNDLATVRELFAYTSWADALVWQAVIGDAGASADARVRDTHAHAHRTPPTTDFIMWVLLGKPEADWPETDA